VPGLRVPAFIVIGGGTIGAATARQLLRARAAGKLETDRIVIVDKNPACAAASLPYPVELHVSEWTPWLAAHLASFGREDHFVPDHWAPHLLREWLAGEIARRGGRVQKLAMTDARGLPFEATTRDGDRALSYASWVCPPRCIEPALCPHTRGPKDWSLADDLARPAPGEPEAERIVFRCLHLVYGVGTVPVSDILDARDRLLKSLETGGRRYVVATSSHCHALATTFEIIPSPH
jgi:hypothetical protein